MSSLRKAFLVSVLLLMALAAAYAKAPARPTSSCVGTSMTLKEMEPKAGMDKAIRRVCVCVPNHCCCGPIGQKCTWD